MPTTRVVIEVFDSRIIAMNAPGGEINRFVRKITRETKDLAVAYCPTRTHELQRSISSSVGWNAIGVFSKVKADAGYAKFVHEGTHTPILPRTTPYLKFYGWGPWARPEPYRRDSVHGQRANPFLRRALQEVVRANLLG